MKRIACLVVVVAAVAGVVADTAPASGESDGEAAPVFGSKVPSGYRDWRVISVAHVGPPLNDLRIKLGNDVAIKALRDGTLPLPDGTIIARLAYQQVTSQENDKLLRGVLERQGLPPAAVTKLLAESFVAGTARARQGP
jgi:Cytochrome P460